MSTPKRQGTMQQTAEEGREYLKNEGADHLLPDVHDEDEDDHPPAPGRQGTMQATAAEGIEYLKAAGEDKLLEIQGLLPTNGNGASKRKHDEDEDEEDDFDEDVEDDEEANGAPSLEKQGTMHATAKEGEQLLEWMGGAPDPAAKTRGQQRELASERDEPDVKKPKVARDTTIQQTTKITGQEMVIVCGFSSFLFLSLLLCIVDFSQARYLETRIRQKRKGDAVQLACRLRPDLPYCPEAAKKASANRIDRQTDEDIDEFFNGPRPPVPVPVPVPDDNSDNLPVPSTSLGTNPNPSDTFGSQNTQPPLTEFVGGVQGPTPVGPNPTTNTTGDGLYHGDFYRPTEEQLMFWCDKGKAIAIQRCQGPEIEPKYIEQCGAYFADCRYFFSNSEPLRHIANWFSSQFGIGFGINVGVPGYPINRDGNIGVSTNGRADYGTWGGGWTDAVGVRDFYEQQREYGANWYDGIYGYRQGWSVPVVRNLGIEGEGGTAVSVPINERNLGAPISVDTGYQVGPYFGYDDGTAVDWYHGGVSKTYSVDVPIVGVGVNTGLNVDFPSIGDYIGKRKRK